MSYNYLDNEFGLSMIIDDINNKIKYILDDTREEKVVGEVEKIVLKEVSMFVVPAVDDYAQINVFTHRFAITFYGDAKGRYFNNHSFHSDSMYEQELNTYFPDDFEFIYDDKGIVTESKYVLSEQQQEVSKMLNKLKYRQLFESEFMEKVLAIFNKIGYKAENDL